MTDTNTLAPCPFCGERAETDFIPEHHSYQIECSDSIGCTARITRDSELGAIEAWNCRAALAAPAQPVAWQVNHIADHVADNWPMRKYDLAEIEQRLRGIPAAPTPPLTHIGDKP